MHGSISFLNKINYIIGVLARNNVKLALLTLCPIPNLLKGSPFRSTLQGKENERHREYQNGTVTQER